MRQAKGWQKGWNMREGKGWNRSESQGCTSVDGNGWQINDCNVKAKS